MPGSAASIDHQGATSPEPPPLLAARLRRLVVVIASLGIATAAIGLLPGEQVYSCHVSFTFGTEGGSTYCGNDVPLRTTPAGGLPLVAYVLVLLVPALALYRKPGAGRAWLWLAWNFVELVVGFAIAIYEALQHMTFGGGSSSILWPGWAVGAGMLAIQVYLFVVLPITIVRSRRPQLPRAQVVGDR